jgi:hypothetical protein
MVGFTGKLVGAVAIKVGVVEMSGVWHPCSCIITSMIPTKQSNQKLFFLRTMISSDFVFTEHKDSDDVYRSRCEKHPAEADQIC